MRQANQISETPISETPPSQELEELDQNIRSLSLAHDSNSRTLKREKKQPTGDEIPLLELNIKECERLIIEFLERRKKLTDALTGDIAEISKIFSTAAE